MSAAAPVLDANGDTVVLPEGFVVTEEFRAFMAGRLPAPNCPHYMPASEILSETSACEACTLGRLRS